MEVKSYFYHSKMEIFKIHQKLLCYSTENTAFRNIILSWES